MRTLLMLGLVGACAVDSGDEYPVNPGGGGNPPWVSGPSLAAAYSVYWSPLRALECSPELCAPITSTTQLKIAKRTGGVQFTFAGDEESVVVDGTAFTYTTRWESSIAEQTDSVGKRRPFVIWQTEDLALYGTAEWEAAGNQLVTFDFIASALP